MRAHGHPYFSHAIPNAENSHLEAIAALLTSPQWLLLGFCRCITGMSGQVLVPLIRMLEMLLLNSWRAVLEETLWCPTKSTVVTAGRRNKKREPGGPPLQFLIALAD